MVKVQRVNPQIEKGIIFLKVQKIMLDSLPYDQRKIDEKHKSLHFLSNLLQRTTRQNQMFLLSFEKLEQSFDMQGNVDDTVTINSKNKRKEKEKKRFGRQWKNEFFVKMIE